MRYHIIEKEPVVHHSKIGLLNSIWALEVRFAPESGPPICALMSSWSPAPCIADARFGMAGKPLARPAMIR